MNNRIKVAVFVLVVTCWAGTMAYTLIGLHETPDPLLWGVPAGAYTTFWPPSNRRDDDNR